MSPFFKNRVEKRKDQLHDILNLDIDYEKGMYHDIKRFLVKHYQAITIALLVLSIIWVTAHYYNVLVKNYQKVSNLHSQIESALQMRQNIIPALTVVVYQFVTHEKNMFLSAVDARENSLSVNKKPLSKNLLKNLNGALNSSNALSKIMAIAENYPQLVTSDSYRLLLGQIADVENQIYKKRVEYNDAVNVYNTRFLTFPVNLIGGMLGFSKQPYFEWTNKPEWAFSEKSSSGELPISMETEGIQNGR